MMDINNLVWKLQEFLVVFLIAIIAIYIYLSIAIKNSSKNTGISKEWANISWFGITIPYLMANSARKPFWPTVVLPLSIFLLSFFSIEYPVANILIVGLMIIFIGYMIYLKWEICEQREIHGWWALVSPGLILLAIVLVAISESLGIVSIILTALGLIWYLVLWGLLAWGH